MSLEDGDAKRQEAGLGSLELDVVVIGSGMESLK